MSKLNDLFNPPQEEADSEAQYRFDNDVNETLSALTYIMNPSVLTNANIGTLGPSGTTPITQGDGDNFEIMDDWFVVGASVATYTITATAYPTGAITNTSPSSVVSAGDYYEKVVVATKTGDPFYIYQRQSGTVRKYQQSPLSFGIWIRNNQNKVIKVGCEVYSYYDTANDLQQGKALYLQPGMNKLTSLVNTESLVGKTIGAGNYTEFRLKFIDLVDGTADLDIYQIKCEYGTVSTLLEQ